MGKENNLVDVYLLARLKFSNCIVHDLLLYYMTVLSKYVYSHIKGRRTTFGRPGCVMRPAATYVNSVCVYVCMYVCTCVYVYLYVCMYVRVCVFICMYLCVYIRMYECMCVCMYVFMYVRIYVYMHVCV